MGNYRLLNGWFIGTMYYLYVKKIHKSPKSSKYMIDYKLHKKRVYKIRKTNKLWVFKVYGLKSQSSPVQSNIVVY